VIRGNTQGPRNCNNPTVSCGRGAKIAAIRGNTQGAEIAWGWGAKISRREGGGGKYKEGGATTRVPCDTQAL
jgi:hypothetical protein